MKSKPLYYLLLTALIVFLLGNCFAGKVSAEGTPTRYYLEIKNNTNRHSGFYPEILMSAADGSRPYRTAIFTGNNLKIYLDTFASQEVQYIIGMPLIAEKNLAIGLIPTNQHHSIQIVEIDPKRHDGRFKVEEVHL